jgi:hypothetical protein
MALQTLYAVFQLNKVLWNLSMEETRIPQNMQMSVDFWFVCVEHHKPRVSSEDSWATVFSGLFLGR